MLRMNHFKMNRVPWLLIATLLVFLAGCEMGEEAQIRSTAVNFVECFIKEEPTDFRPYLSGTLEEKNRECLEFTMGMNIESTEDDAWKQVYKTFSDSHIALATYDPSWKVETSSHGNRGEAEFIDGDRTQFRLAMVRTDSGWKVALDASPGPFDF